MLSGVRLSGGYRDDLDLWMGEPTASRGFFLKSAEGIGPYEVNLYSTEYALLAGGVYDNSTPASRDIVLSVGFDPDWGSGQTVAELRNELYLAAPPGKRVKVQLYNSNGPSLLIEGVVESNAPNMFSKDPDVQISIFCSQPVFREVLQNSTTVEGVNGTYMVIDYQGTEPTGFYANVFPRSNDVDHITIRHTANSPASLSGRPGLTLRSDFRSLNRIMINTRPSTRDLIRFASNDDYISRLFDGYTVHDDQWPMLYPGINRLNLSTGVTGGTSRIELTYLTMFMGF